MLSQDVVWIQKNCLNLQATKLFCDIGYQGGLAYHPLDLVFGSKYCIVCVTSLIHLKVDSSLHVPLVC